jgi:hypothetical protein
MGFKRVEVVELGILTEICFFPVKAPSFRPGFVHSQLRI